MRNLRKPYLAPPPWFDASGCFETCRVRDGEILHLQEHMKRLQASMKTLGMEIQDRLVEGRTERQLREAARRVGNGFVRIAVRRQPNGVGRFLIHEHPGIPYTAGQIRRGVEVVTAVSRWPLGEPAPALAKGSERLGSILARLEGKQAKEVLRLGPLGYLTEGTVSNLFLIKEGTVWTPPSWLGVLEGVARGRLLKLARRLKIPVRGTPFTRHDLFNADEAFLTNVLMGILPISRVDGRRIGTRVPGPITRRLLEGFR